jgi:2-polyprenyl-3-methyl-5-hydroxy-6-metoxy-1,4-benzoquinol methylase
VCRISGLLYDEGAVDFPKITYVPDKIAFLAEVAAGKDVLHVGCADAVADIHSKDSRGRLLHRRLEERARELWGCDIDEEALERLRSSFGIERLVVADAESLQREDFGGRTFDVIIAPEVIEHLPNPAGLLKSAAQMLRPQGRLCLTTPNGALRIKTWLHSLRGVEDAVPEHVVLFSFASLSAMYERFGYAAPRWFSTFERHGSSLNTFANALLEPLVKRFPRYADCIISLTTRIDEV